jgi:hypothetical protein
MSVFQKYFNILITAFIVNIGIAQNIDFVSDLKITEVEQSFLVSWVIDSGQTCQGQNILHSTDGINFEEVGRISGVCGSLLKAEPYIFTHLEPEPNSVNYYRIELGGYGLSAIVSSFLIEITENSAVIYPNPVSSLFTIKWNNRNSSKVVIKLSNQQGQTFSQLESNSDTVLLDATSWEKGFYYYIITIEDTGKVISGKLIVN